MRRAGAIGIGYPEEVHRRESALKFSQALFSAGN
jgi:hypothetical protein